MTSQPENLQALRRAFARGEIDAKTYRNVRRALVTAIASGALPASDLRPLVELPPSMPMNSAGIESTLQVSRPLSSESRSPQLEEQSERHVSTRGSPRALWIAGATAGALLIGVLAFLWPKVPSMPGLATREAALSSAPNSEELQALETFLRDQDWTAARLTDALGKLTRLQESAEGTNAARLLVRRLQTAVAERVEEQANLSEIGGDSEQAHPELIALARALDVRVDSLEQALPTTAALSAEGMASTTPPSGSSAFPRTPNVLTPTTSETPTPPPTIIPGNVPYPTTTEIEMPSASQPVTAAAPTPPSATESPPPETAEPAATPAPDTNLAAAVVAPPPAAMEVPSVETPVTPLYEPVEQSAALTSPTEAPVADEPQAAVSTQPATEPVAAAPVPLSPPIPAVASARRAGKGCEALVGVKFGGRRTPVCSDVLASGEKGPTMIGVPAGAFEMGGDRVEEQPKREIRIPHAFAVAKFETSQAEFQKFAGATGYKLAGQLQGAPTFPIVGVSWDDANAYAKWLSDQTGATYRLPTEAEWEYAARAGANTRWPDGNDSFPGTIVASELGERSAPDAVTRGTANGFKLVHMLGNVGEWVSDAWQGNLAGAPTDGGAVPGSGQKVVRGGNYTDRKDRVTLSARIAQEQGAGSERTGFRVVRALR